MTPSLHSETTLIIGVMGVGKTTLAAHALKSYGKAVVITTFPDDFGNCTVTNKSAKINRDGKTVFVCDDYIENEIAMRLTYELGNRLLVIDEAHIYQSSDTIKKIIRYSRKQRLDVILISHSFFDFARVNRHLISNIIVMRMTDEKGRGDNFEIEYIERMSPDTKVRDIRQYDFTFVKGDFPKWLKPQDYIEQGGFYRLKRG